MARDFKPPTDTASLPRRIAQPTLSAVPKRQRAADVAGSARADRIEGAGGAAERRRAIGAMPGTPADRRVDADRRVATPAQAVRKAQLAFAGALPPARIPPESLATPRRMSTVGIAIGASIALHSVALALHFNFGIDRFVDRTPPLQVALVNAKSATKPAKPDILAQANLDGGGNTDQDRHAKTPLPVLPRETPRQNVAVASARQEVQDNATHEMLTQLRSTLPIPTPEAKPLEEAERTESPTANEMMQKTLEAIRLEAQIARDMDAYQKRPRRHFIGAQAKEYRFARYVEDWRMKVERIGNLNYPEAARQNKLYGSLILTVSIRADGSVENVEVKHKSGQRILDAAAVRIVEMAGPYAPFPDDIRRDTDILNITRTWTFAKGDELHGE
jgi:protein TonB